MNNERCDRQGRFVVGGLDENGLRPTSSVVRYTGGESEVLLEAVGCAKSSCFAPESDHICFADTPSGQIKRFAYGALSLPRPSVCFGGADLDHLHIMTARQNMSDAKIEDYPLAGGIFVARPGTTGLPETRFAQTLFCD